MSRDPKSPVQLFDDRPCLDDKMRARARVSVLTAFVVFVLCQIGLRFYIERDAKELRDPTFEVKYRNFTKLIAKSPTPPATVVCLGSSCTYQGVKPDILKTALEKQLGRDVVAYNFGIGAAGPVTQMITMQRLVRRGTPPTLAVIELSPFLYGQPNDLSKFDATTIEAADIETIASFSKDKDLRKDFVESYLVPVHGHRLAILNVMASVFVPFKDRLQLWREHIDEFGWYATDVVQGKDLEGNLARISQQSHLSTLQPHADCLRALRTTAQLLQREKIQGLFVFMPEGPTMRSVYTPEYIAKLKAEQRAIAQEYGIAMVDAFEWLADERFTDSYHLNRVGAEEFTRRLYDEAIQPLAASLK